MTLLLPAAAPLLGGALGLGAIGVWVSGRREFLLKWLSFLAATPILLLAVALGTPGVTAFAGALAAVCTWEYARMLRLDRWTAGSMLAGVGVQLGLAITGRALSPGALLVLSVAVPLVAARAGDGHRQAAAVAWGTLWLGCSLAAAVTHATDLLPVAAAVSLGDVAAYFGGAAVNRRAAARMTLGMRLSPISPNKTVAGAVTGSVAALAVLAALGDFTAITAVAVTLGAVAGDLIESMVKRGSGAKDAGRWLPGFGGLLDRVDSLLGALLVLAVLS